MRTDLDELFEDDDDAGPMSRARVVVIGVGLAAAVISAAWFDGREAAARCRAGIDTVASCRGIVR